jgi:O-antigen ligase
MSVLQYAMQKNARILWALAASLPVVFGIAEENYYIGIALAGLGLSLLFLVKFEIIFPLLLIARSSLDIFTDVGFYIGPLNFNVPSSVSIFIDVMGLLYLGMIYIREKISLFDNIAKAFLIWVLSLLFWVFLAYLNLGEEGLGGIRDWGRLFSLFVIYLLSLQLSRLKGHRYVLNWILFSLIVPLSIGYYQIFFQPHLYVAGGHRIYGTVTHPNVFSLYLVLFIGVTLWKLKFSGLKLPWLGVIFAILFALVNTFSISGLVMLTVFISLFVYVEFEMKYRIMILLFFIIFIVIFINTEMGQKRIDSLKRTPPLMVIVNDEIVTNSFAWRIVNWKILFEKWTNKPFLGYGLNTSRVINPWHMSAAHNDYLRFLVELGLIGFSIYLCFLARIGFLIRDRLRFCDNEEQRYLIMLVGIVYISWIIGSSVGNFIMALTFQFYFWSIIGAVMTNRIEDKKYVTANTNEERLNYRY